VRNTQQFGSSLPLGEFPVWFLRDDGSSGAGAAVTTEPHPRSASEQRWSCNCPPRNGVSITVIAATFRAKPTRQFRRPHLGENSSASWRR